MLDSPSYPNYWLFYHIRFGHELKVKKMVKERYCKFDCNFSESFAKTNTFATQEGIKS